MGLVHRIESAQNDTVKHLLKLMSSNARMKQAGVALAEGLHLVQGLLKYQTEYSVDSVFFPDSLEGNAEWVELEALLMRHGSFKRFVMPISLYKKMSKLNTPTGPLVVFQLPKVPLHPLNLQQDVVVLDDIQDPGNVGTLLRNCAAAGVRQVVATQGCAWVWSDKALRAGMCAQFGLLFFTESELLEALAQHTETPVRVTSLVLQSTPVFQTNLRAAGVWVFGSEGQGVGVSWLERANQHVRIPQTDWVDSLNVASSSAVCLFEQLRQRSH